MFSPRLCWCNLRQATTGWIMGQVLHGCARTTVAVRRAPQHSQKSLNGLAEPYGINPKAVAKWKKRGFANDAPMGPKDVRSTVLTKEEEAAVVAFRKYTLLPLDDCLHALQPSIPHLTRSSFHRCLQRHGISRLPEVEGDKTKKQKILPYRHCRGATGRRQAVYVCGRGSHLEVRLCRSSSSRPTYHR